MYSAGSGLSFFERKRMKILMILLILALCLPAAALLRTLTSPPRKASYRPSEKDDDRALAYARKLSAMVRYDTTSVRDTDQRDLFLGYHRVLEDQFPLVHRYLEKTEIGGNLLYCWKGKSSEKPIVLMGHQDVVPASGDWDRDPFSGDIEDGSVWGRGAVDTKCSVMAFMQAAEELLSEGAIPPMDIYFSSSCTEEWGGPGCCSLVDELKRRGVRPFLVLDEGGGIYTDPMFGIRGNFAMVGVFEKGKANVRFTAEGRGGHPATPVKNSPIARLSAFVTDVEKRQPFRCRLEPSVRAMLETLAPYGSFPIRLVLGNLWLFSPLVTWGAPLVSGQAAAMLRSTISFTMASGSQACNVMPEKASVSANMRFIPHQGMEESLEIIRKRAARFGLKTEVIEGSDFTPPVDIRGDAFRLVADTVRETFPDCPVSPFVLTAATDAVFYQEICDSCIRFAPVVYSPEEKRGIHGINEHLHYNSLPGAVDFFKNLIMAGSRE